MPWFHLKGMLDEFGYKELRMMWYLLPDKCLETGLREMNTNIEIWEMTELGIKYEMIAVGVAVDSGVAMDGGVPGEGGIVVDNKDKDEDEDDTEYYPPEEEESDAYSSADDEYNSNNDNEEFLEGHILRITQGNRQSEMQVDEERPISHQGEESDEQAASDDNEVTPHNSADEGECSRSSKRLNVFNPKCDMASTKFQVGLCFTGPKKFIRALKDYAIYHGFSLRFLRSGEKKVEVVCKANCP
ncbi:hypothetical protein CRG98_006775 [Punica granatum]|uniref:Transposase MuDR plant domain-containing protein n=1 Tax=Punica granatum TaxID=22663 RepID=A0A2I0KWE8_PUNGR|nr:hypothetical protein CRG98_006775 [Punica granatum]